MTEVLQDNLNTQPAAQTNLPAQDAQPVDPYAAVSLPENSLLGPETLAAMKQTACEVNLPLSALQKWISLEQTRLQTWVQHTEQAQCEQRQNWARQTQAQFGPHWQEEVSKAVRAADVFGGPELRQLLEETGLGNHPVIVRTFHTVAARISEDVAPGGAPSASADKTFTQALYGKN